MDIQDFLSFFSLLIKIPNSRCIILIFIFYFKIALGVFTIISISRFNLIRLVVIGGDLLYSVKNVDKSQLYSNLVTVYKDILLISILSTENNIISFVVVLVLFSTLIFYILEDDSIYYILIFPCALTLFSLSLSSTTVMTGLSVGLLPCLKLCLIEIKELSKRVKSLEEKVELLWNVNKGENVILIKDNDYSEVENIFENTNRKPIEYLFSYLHKYNNSNTTLLDVYNNHISETYSSTQLGIFIFTSHDHSKFQMNHLYMVTLLPSSFMRFTDCTDLVSSQVKLSKEKYENILFSKISHEVKTGTIGIIYLLNDLQEFISKFDSAIQIPPQVIKNFIVVNLIKIQILSENISYSITSIFDYIRLTFHKNIDLEIVPISDIKIWISCVLTTLIEIYNKSEVIFNIEVDEILLDLTIEVDIQKLRISLMEIFKNSIFNMDKGLITVDIKSTYLLDKSIRGISIEVTDEGNGISDDKLIVINHNMTEIEKVIDTIKIEEVADSNTNLLSPNIFNTSNNFSSDGKLLCGLKIIKSYSKVMNIDFSIESEYKKGTKVKLYLVLNNNVNDNNISNRKSIINITTKPSQIGMKSSKFIPLNTIRDIVDVNLYENKITSQIIISNYESTKSFQKIEKELNKKISEKLYKLQLDDNEINDNDQEMKVDLDKKYRFFSEKDKKVNDCNRSLIDINRSKNINFQMKENISNMHNINNFKSADILTNVNNLNFKYKNQRKSIENEIQYFNINKGYDVNSSQGCNFNSKKLIPESSFKTLNIFNQYPFNETELKFKYILVVDDESLVRKSVDKLIFKYLTNQNKANEYKIIRLEDGLDTLNMVVHNKLDIRLIISDENMKYISGSQSFELLTYLMNKNVIPNIPLVILTALEDNNYINNIKIRTNCKEVIIKPLNMSKIEKVLKYI